MGRDDHVHAAGVGDTPRDKIAVEIADPREIAGFFVRLSGHSRAAIRLAIRQTCRTIKA